MNKPLAREQVRVCDLCDKPHETLNVYLVRVEQHILSPDALRRTAGLEMMMGGGQDGAVLASVMGPDKEFSVILNEHEKIVCQDCMMKRRLMDVTY